MRVARVVAGDEGGEEWGSGRRCHWGGTQFGKAVADTGSEKRRERANWSAFDLSCTLTKFHFQKKRRGANPRTPSKSITEMHTHF